MLEIYRNINFRRRKMKFCVSDQFINVKNLFYFSQHIVQFYFFSRIMWKSFLCPLDNAFFSYQHLFLHFLGSLLLPVYSLLCCLFMFSEKMEIIKLELLYFATIE